jgi:hypothetical protein
MNEHTPGPWHVAYDVPEVLPRHPHDVIAFQVQAKAGPIADVFAPAGRDWRDRASANAQLIAAAPDLAAALLRYVQQEETSAPYSASPLRLAARAALEKAGIR